MYKLKKFVWILLILTIGCAPQIPLSKFENLNNSSQSLYKNLTTTYSRFLELQQIFAVITAPDSAIDRNVFKPQINGQSFDFTPELRYREAAFTVLVNYLTVLQSLITKDYLIDIEQASRQLAVSVDNFIETSNFVQSPEAPGVFSTLVNIISRQLVKKKKLTALKQVMDLAQQDIEKLATLIVASNQKIKGAVEIMLNQVLQHFQLMRPQYGTLNRYYFDLEIAKLIEEVDQVEASLDIMNKAILTIPQAHKQIRSELDHKPTSINALKKLMKEAYQANKFYQKLK